VYGKAQMPFVSARQLSDDERRRYGRHLVLPEVGPAGQSRLRDASVAIVGVGGLGSPAALYLAAAGVGRIGLIDGDRVDLTNLQRQVLFQTADVNMPKASTAAARLRGLNPYVQVDVLEVRLTADNALDLLRPYDIVIDATDNFAARYLINDACALLGKPDVFGSVFRFEGQVSVFDAARGPCYRCLHPVPPAPHLAPSCAEGGVLGVLPGIIGSMQAAEAISLILGVGQPLVGWLGVFDALSMNLERLAVAKDPQCPLCGDRRTITRLADVPEQCEPERSEGTMSSISVEQLKQMMDAKSDFVLIDVREPYEYEYANLGGILIPLRDLPARFQELDPLQETVVHCHTGVRSANAVAFLQSRGFMRVHNLTGGIAAWSKRIDPTVPSY
jgi:molybdopterin/thiamine biosynthesis adenylyltransferase/rhodanese-related sulfurtransferase